MKDDNRDPLLDARGLHRAVGGQVLWTELSVRLAGGERVAITGPSGSGKTLLMRTLAGLEALEAGAIRFRGTSLERWRMPEYRSHVLLLPQRPALPEGTVEAALEAPFGFRVHRQRRYERARALSYLEPVGRGRAFLERPTDALSGGEAQLAALLRALLLEPQLLLLDEPTASLDATAAGAVEALVGAWLQGSADRAYLWTSHDPAQIARVSDRRVEVGAS